jgi:hypothetical protein
MPAAPAESEAADGHDWGELAAVLLLSVTAILTAWTGFQASNWGGAMSISFADASSARMQAARLDADANRRITVQASLFTQWLQAHQAKDETLATFLSTRFPEPLATAFPAWLATDPATNPNAPATPFEMKEYAIPETQRARRADAKADASYAAALVNNQRGDNYTLLTVAFATVLFFAALSGRMRTARARRFLLGLGFVGFIAASVVLMSFPRLI